MIDKKKIGDKIGAITSNVNDKTKELVEKSKNKITTVVDVNGDGKVDVEDIVVLGLKTPGVKINRSEFLSKEFEKNYDKTTIENAIANTPSSAGIPISDLNKIADNVIKFEQKCVTGISVALGMPGGAAMAATISADIIQYYG